MAEFNFSEIDYSELATLLANTTDDQVNDLIQSVITAQGTNFPFPTIPHETPQYNFSISFPKQDSNAKKVTWTYSQILNKLYVKRCEPCAVNFSTNGVLMEEGSVYIRATAVYAAAEIAAKAVRRCFTHQRDDEGLASAEHVVRSEAPSAIYLSGPNEHRSVIVPFENPSVGESFSTYLFSFGCFSSCSGGPNRRPMNVVFTLERNNQILGSCAVGLKVCACPGRDRAADEAPPKPSSTELNPPVIELENDSAKKFTEHYKMTTDNYDKFKFLRVMKRFKTIERLLKEHPEHKQHIFMYLSSSEDSSA